MFHFQRQCMHQIAEPNGDVATIVHDGRRLRLPVYTSETKAERIPYPASATKKPYRDVEHRILSHELWKLLETPMTTTQMRPQLNRVLTTEVVPENEKETYLAYHLLRMKRDGYLIKRNKKWRQVKRPPMPCTDNEYITYQAMRSHVDQLKSWGMRSSRRGKVDSGLADALKEVLVHLPKALARWDEQIAWRVAHIGVNHPSTERDIYLRGVADVVVSWIRAAPWIDPSARLADPPSGSGAHDVNGRGVASAAATDDWYEVWDGTTKVGDVPCVEATVDVEAVRWVEEFLCAHVRYPYTRRVPMGPPRVVFKSHDQLRSFQVNSLVYDGTELRVIVACIDRDMFQVASRGENRRTIHKPMRRDQLRPAWSFRFTASGTGAPSVHDVMPKDSRSYVTMTYEWFQEFTDKVEYILEIRMI